MCNGIFKDTYDTHYNRYILCYKYMKSIKDNRSKRKHINTSNKNVFWSAVNKLKFEEKDKLKKNTRYFVILSFYVLNNVLPFPTSINYVLRIT